MQSRPEIREYLEPEQLGLSQAGVAKLVHGVRGLLNHQRDFVCVRLDLKNAYSESQRSAIIDVLQSEPSLSHLVTFAGVILAPEAGLEARGKLWGESNTGVVRGDPALGAFFAVGLQPSLVTLNKDCQEGGGMARAGADDVYAIGLPEVVIPAVIRFAHELWERCRLGIQWTKSGLFAWEGGLPDNTPPGIQLAGKEVDGVFERGIEVYGIPVGTDKYVSNRLEAKVTEIIRDARKTGHLLAEERQALWTTLHLSISVFPIFCTANSTFIV